MVQLSSPPCTPSETGADQRRDVARWRHATRETLRAERLARRDRAEIAERISVHLQGFLTEHLGGARGRTLSGFWPIKGEPDLRPLLARLHAQGVTIALPVVETPAAPLVFRLWTPETAMVRGFWNIPVPPPQAPEITPEISLAPLVGWDGNGFRLGYGGGYFDRTLAALSPRPHVIGIGLQEARLPTIFPQPHDIPMDFILTEAGLQVDRTGLADPPLAFPPPDMLT